MSIEQQILAYMEVQANNQLADQMLSQPVMVPENLYVEQIGGGGGEGWVPFFSVSLGPAGGEAANLVGVGYGLVEHAGVGRFESSGAYVAVTAAATEIAPHYFIGRYKYSDNTIAFVVRSTAPMTEINDYFEWQLCTVWLNTSGATDTAVTIGPFGSGPVRIGGVLLS